MTMDEDGDGRDITCLYGLPLMLLQELLGQLKIQLDDIRNEP